MEIHNTYSEKKSKLKGDKSLVKRFFSVFIALIAFGCFAVVFIVYGAYLYKTEQLFHEIFFAKSLAKKDLSFVSKKAESSLVEIDEFDINIKFVDYEKLRYYREKTLANDDWCTECKSEVPAEIVYKGKKYDVGLSLNGQVFVHIYHPTKWSFAVKVKGGKTIKGMNKFALLLPQSRGYLTDWIAHKVLEARRVIGLRSDFVGVSVNGLALGVYYLEERYDKLLVESNRFREGIVFRIEGDAISTYGQGKILQSSDLSQQLTNLESLWQGLLNGEVKEEELFDMQKMASAVAVCDLMGQKHPLKIDNIRFYYNSSTNLIEPIVREFEFMVEDDRNTPQPLFIEQPTPGYSTPEVHHREVLASHVKKIIDNPKFEELYLKELEIVSKKSYLDSVFDSNKNELDALLNKAYIDNPFYVFPKDVLYANQRHIRSKIYPTNPALKLIEKELKKGSLSVEVENKIDLPFEIDSLVYAGQKMTFNDRILIQSNHRTDQNQLFDISGVAIDTVTFRLDSLRVYYRVLGLGNTMIAKVFPKEIKEKKSVNPVKQSSSVHQFSFLKVDQKAKTIRFNGTKCTINKDLMIPDGYVVSADAGITIDIINGARIISYSPLVLFGSKERPIKITSNDSSGQGIVVYNTPKQSELSYIEFTNLSNIVDYGWNLKGAITFYESPVVINNCLFKDNKRGDDYLNVIRTNFIINNSVFDNTLADALDTDFSNGTIENVQFLKVGNDAIDVSGTQLFAKNIKIISPEDKGISGGEKSHLKFENVVIEGGEIGVTSKDNSVVEVDGLSINSTKLGYCAFQKKPEYGPGVIKIKKATLKDVGTKQLIEVGSTLLIDGKSVEQKTKNVSKMLYGSEFGKKS